MLNPFGNRSNGNDPPLEQRTIFWGNRKRPLPFDQAREHNFLIMGAIGSGKTSVLLVILHDIMPYITEGSGQRAIVYDPKTEFLPYLASMVPEGAERLRILHPRDRRAYAWDIAADIAHHEDATGIANTLIPDRRATGGGSEQFFTEMSRGLVLHTLIGLKKLLGTDWNFRDFVNTMLTPDLRGRVVAVTDEGRNMLAELGADRTESNIKADIRSRFERFRRLGDFMDHHAREGRKLSLKEWVRTESVLVLGRDREPASLLDDLNRTIMQRLQATLLSAEHNPVSVSPDGRPTSGTALILDEFSGFAEKNSLMQLLLEGRSYGLCTLLSFQTRHALISAYGGEADVKTLTSQLGNIMVLRLGDFEDAQWAADVLGKQEIKKDETEQLDDAGRTTGYSLKRHGPRVEEHIYSPSEIRGICADGTVGGFARSTLDQKPFQFKLNWKNLQAFRSRDESFPAHDFFPSDWKPRPWDRRRIEAALDAYESRFVGTAGSEGDSKAENAEAVLDALRRFQQSHHVR
ncbi:type IV secretion system DNA-binding domain-containing protein [Aeoliella sp. ICT_H6.2]|uniref:Type IV secretion system DNA-binding domain-containing protein n=1 Tax=Aeoliella straminimaris TaxID=2954799 RepID=A0A9X2F6J1_9BACT|nr:type IV secretion system DNA-binding domain-containing protein [Aeoliella straminimaris]MCO6042699.1 type IV secretion system DNA-binding domain-containing protein [Aeoliella straminimaris]